MCVRAQYEKSFACIYEYKFQIFHQDIAFSSEYQSSRSTVIVFAWFRTPCFPLPIRKANSTYPSGELMITRDVRLRQEQSGGQRRIYICLKVIHTMCDNRTCARCLPSVTMNCK